MRHRFGRLMLAMAISGASALGLSGAAPQAPKPGKMEDLAYNKPATASSFQSDDKFAGAAVDGEDDSRWCASDGSTPQWLQVDLGKPEALTGCRILWEAAATYAYKVEGSTDGKSWSVLSDHTRDPSRAADRMHKFAAKDVRHVRVEVTGTPEGQWASLFAFEVFGTRPAPVVARAGPKKADDAAVLKGIKAPDGFEVTAFASPPDVRYPTCLAASPTGEVFVGIDENGSLDAKANRGRVVRCIDTDGDGKADKFNVFASMDSPRGVIWDAGTLYVLHPPTLTAFKDTDGDGTADKSEVLVNGLGFDLKFRGADHTTNGIRMGIDGFIYVAVGDYGFIKAEGKDKATRQMLGGGIVRVRTDGTGLEIVSRGQRNIYDVAIDPKMDLFTRDNTNDGDGWDVRLSHVVPTAHYGYPSLFKRFGDEHLQPLADYGGGSPCGSLYLQEPGFPAPFGDMLYTCEWGRGAVFMHPLTPSGAGFKAGQEQFLAIPRPTDMDVDGSGRIYVASWRDGGFTFSKPDVGYVIRVVPKDLKPAPFPDLKADSDAALVRHITADSAVLRLAAQRELLRRGTGADLVSVSASLLKAAADDGPLPGRVAAIFTLAQWLGPKSDAVLIGLAKSTPAVREFAIKALAGRRDEIRMADWRPRIERHREDRDPKDRAKADLILKDYEARQDDARKLGLAAISPYLADLDPRVRLQATIAAGRLNLDESAPAVLGLTTDADPIVAHAAVKALVNMEAIDACLKGLDDAKLAPGASRALAEIHEPASVLGLIKKLDSSRDMAPRKPALKALARLYFRESPYEGKWWGTRPDTSGPYYSPTTWEGSEAVARALRSALHQADDVTARWLLAELLRNKVDLEETTGLALKLASTDPAIKTAMIDLFTSRPKLSLDAIKFLEATALSDPDTAARAKALRGLLRHQTQQEARESALRGLAAVAEADEPPADVLGVWLDFTKDNRQVRDGAGSIRMAEGADAGRSVLGYGILLQVEANNRTPEPARDEAKRALDRAWTAPMSAARLLRAIGLAKMDSMAAKVRPLLASSDPEVRPAADFAARRLNLATESVAAKPSTGKPIAALAYDLVVATALADKGDVALGARLFEKQGCVNCHSVAKSDPIKGPYLGDITTRYNRAELSESILKPSAKISQGFETQKIALTTGQTYEGFVVRESGDELEMRNSAGAVAIVPKKEIEERGKSELSVMPNGLLDPLTPHDLASILAYLESLKGK